MSGIFFMHRFFSSHPLKPELRLDDWEQFHQIFHVFRAKKWDLLIFFESGGDDRVYEIIEVTKKSALLSQKEVRKKRNTTSQIVLFQAYPHKLSTIELIVQKSTELWVGSLIFFPSKYSQIHSIPEMKKQRISAIALEALEQSGWNTPPTIIFTEDTVEELLQKNKHAYHIIASPHDGADKKIPLAPLGLWVWPEWGWSPDEMTLFRENMCHFWLFNSRILRAETAAIVGLGILSYLSL